jgi:chemotaxis receptor (MCP) glutamine deamidase CheD
MSDEPEDVTLYIGGIFASNEHAVIRTTLGSCIAVCLFDPVAVVGGMNHYMLPDCSTAVAEPGRYGVHSMELLIGAIQRAGGSRARLVAKVFGGGHVIDTREHDESVPARNIAFIQNFLAEERFHVATLDVGGYLPRTVKFETWTGKAFCKRLSKPGAKVLQVEERIARKAPPADVGGDLELFD